MRYFLLIYLLIFNILAKGQVVQLHYSGNNQKLIDAITEANRILKDSSFYKRIDTIAKFDNTIYIGHQIATEMENLNRIIEVREYWNPFSKANASTVSIIKINTAKLKRSLASITNTLVHESVHAVDWWTNQHWDYTHDGNSPNGQSETAPWVIGAIAESMVRNNLTQ